MKKITVIGGGTGTFVVLSGLKEYPDLDLGVIVNMMDSGGSTGKLRDQLGVLPPGDLRQCLVALSEASLLWRKLFLYRFETGDLEGHNFGNIFLSALEKVSSDYNEVLENASYVLKTKGKVIPVTFDKTHLCVEYENGIFVKGEGNIDENNLEMAKIKRAYVDPVPHVNPLALSRLSQSDYIIIGPGDLYTSVIPVLLVPGISSSIVSSGARVIYVTNLMTKAGQTTGYTARNHVEDLTRYLGKKPDITLINNGEIPGNILQWYTSEGEKEVVDDLEEGKDTGSMVKADFLSSNHFQKEQSDTLTRSILRHDSAKLAEVIHSIIAKDKT